MPKRVVPCGPFSNGVWAPVERKIREEGRKKESIIRNREKKG